MLTDALVQIFINNWPMLFIFVMIVTSIRISYLVINNKPFIFYKEVLSLAFIIYILSLFYAVTFQDVTWSTSNFIPFKELLRYEIGSYLFIKNALGNILIFLPFGFFVSYILKTEKKSYILFIALLISSTIEFTQFIIGRVFDIDDIMLNVVGALLGFYLYKIIIKVKVNLPSFLNKTIVYNIISLIVIVVIVMFFLFYLGFGV